MFPADYGFVYDSSLCCCKESRYVFMEQGCTTQITLRADFFIFLLNQESHIWLLEHNHRQTTLRLSQGRKGCNNLDHKPLKSASGSMDVPPTEVANA